MRERWKQVVGYEGWYEVSDRGRVKRVRGGDRNTVAGRILRATPKSTGYLTLMLSKDGVARRFHVHTLVAVAFLGRRPRRKEVNHKNGRKSDCSVTNLEWRTRKFNNQHRCRVLGRGRGIDHYKTWLTPADVREIRRRCGTGEPQRAVGESFGLKQSSVHAIVHRKTWGHVS